MPQQRQLHFMEQESILYFKKGLFIVSLLSNHECATVVSESRLYKANMYRILYRPKICIKPESSRALARSSALSPVASIRRQDRAQGQPTSGSTLYIVTSMPL